jgi:hypothetical protein
MPPTPGRNKSRGACRFDAAPIDYRVRGPNRAAPVEVIMETVVAGWQTTKTWARRVGPYVAIEAIMPGGTLIALALYLWNNRKARAS